MLILTRRPGEVIEIEGYIRITVLAIIGKQAQVRVEAPSEISVSRRTERRIGIGRRGS